MDCAALLRGRSRTWHSIVRIASPTLERFTLLR